MDSSESVASPPVRQADLACLVCRSRKVRCDRTLPDCRNCVRLGVPCPRYERGSELISRKEIQRSAEDIFRAAGVEKRRVGSCEACRASKHRCSRTRPSCRRCMVRKVDCVYPHKQEQDDSPETFSRDTSQAQVSPTQPINWVSYDIDDELERLNFEVLPDDRSLQYRLIDNFFKRSHPLRCLSFIHKPTFMESFNQNTIIEDYGEPVLYAVCALGLRHIYYDAASSIRNRPPPKRVPGKELAERARRQVLDNIHAPSIHDLMAMVLLCDYGIRADQNPMVFVLVAFLYRVIRLLGLDRPQPLEDPSDPDQVVRREIENRLVWACYFIDLFLTTGVNENSCWKDYTPGIPLPGLEEDFHARVPSPAHFLLEVETNLTGAVVQELDMSALTILVIRLRARTLRLIRTHPPALKIWDPNSEFVQIIEHLDIIRLNIAQPYRLTDLSKDNVTKAQALGGLLFFHFLLHAVVFDLTRISLPGYNFPLAAAFHNAPLEFRRQCQDRCRFHATQISDLIRKGLEFGRTVFADVFCADAALESAKIQIIYAATVTQAPRIVKATQQNLDLHLTFFRVFNRGRDGMSPWIKTLLPLCVMFGFRDLAEQYREPQGGDDDFAEVTGSAEIHHLSPFNPFRKAKSQVRTAQPRNSPRRASSSATQPSPSSQRSSSTLPRSFDENTASLPSLRPIDPLAMSTIVEGMPQSDPGPPITLPDLNMPYMPATQPTIDDYTRAADQMSGYLTWQMMELPTDLPPWISYDDFLPFM